MNKFCGALLLLLLIMLPKNSFAWDLWGRSDPLVIVNGQDYRCQDYLNWWYEWKESDQAPTSPDDYINWLLLADEAAQMQLQDKPSYQVKISTFLKVRSMMLLKKEEIDDKIVTPDEKALYNYYLDNFSPRWQLRTVTFRTRENVEKFIAAGEASPKSSITDLLSSLEFTPDDYLLSSVAWERPNRLPPEITALLKKTGDKRFSDPYPWRKTWQVIEILATEPASDEDFKLLTNNLQQHNLKQQKADLTAKFIIQLKKKYPVEIDTDILDKIQYTGVPEELTDHVVLKFLSYQITASELHRAAKQQYDTLAPQQKMKVPFSQTRQQVIDAIVSQNLVDTEALERHYEQKDPLKNTFEFYKKHRLIRELERQIIAPEIKTVTPEAVREAYEKHKVQLSGPPLVEINRGQTTDPDLAARLYEKLREGEDFSAIMAVLGNSNPKPEKLPIKHLVEPLQELIQTLQQGQSGMVEDNGNYLFVRLIRPPKQEIVAFEKVKKTLEDELKRGAFLNRRQEIIHKLRERSTIDVNQKQWQRCLETLEKGA